MEVTSLLDKGGVPVQIVATTRDTELKENHATFESTSWRGPFIQIVAAMCASLAAVSIGFISGYSSLVLPQLVNDTALDYEATRDASWIASLPAVTSIWGSLVGAVIMDRIGPRMTLIATAIPCILSWTMVAFANSIIVMNLGRCITGIFLGVYSPVPQVYATEIAEPKYRGMMGAFPEAAVALGSMLCYVFGSMMSWRWLALVAALVPGIPLFFSMILLPESPQWLTKKSRLTQAENAVRFFRGKDYDAISEVSMIRANIVATEGADISIVQQLKLFRHSQNWKPILMVFLVFTCGQMSGFAVIVNYTVDIFDAADTGINSNASTIIVGVVRFVATIISAVLLDRVGRKPLLIISAIGSSAGMISVGVYFWLKFMEYNVQGLGWLPLASLLFYVFFNELGYGPIPWLLSGELIPLAVRTLGNGVAVTAYSLSAFLTSLSYPMLQSKLHIHLIFWMYAAFSLSGVALSFFLPETRGKTLEEIEAYFAPKNRNSKNGKVISDHRQMEG